MYPEPKSLKPQAEKRKEGGLTYVRESQCFLDRQPESRLLLDPTGHTRPQSKYKIRKKLKEHSAPSSLTTLPVHWYLVEERRMKLVQIEGLGREGNLKDTT
jgi:hypothetical protein